MKIWAALLTALMFTKKNWPYIVIGYLVIGFILHFVFKTQPELEENDAPCRHSNELEDIAISMVVWIIPVGVIAGLHLLSLMCWLAPKIDKIKSILLKRIIPN